ncbi:hypothetical protein IFM12275_06970 [Nocardia sputorum]|uniref:Uncharacterized protein n=1 Tax=Nocardia sputorum TaxID=2984338 RepID=A0ABM8CWK1_9NOCA|nr:hypothetical protein IFM12275_06970 [Nocardia sputorum]BDT99353.1 hypothetical protein IFM12276_23820 [Nocardia sputorum]
MRGIDNRGHVVGRQPSPQPLRAAEAADADRAFGQQGRTHATGERGHDLESSLAGSDVGQLPRFPGAAQKQNSQGWPLK